MPDVGAPAGSPACRARGPVPDAPFGPRSDPSGDQFSSPRQEAPLRRFGSPERGSGASPHPTPAAGRPRVLRRELALPGPSAAAPCSLRRSRMLGITPETAPPVAAARAWGRGSLPTCHVTHKGLPVPRCCGGASPLRKAVCRFFRRVSGFKLPYSTHLHRPIRRKTRGYETGRREIGNMCKGPM